MYVREIEHQVRNVFADMEWVLLLWQKGRIEACVEQIHQFAKRLRTLARALEGVEAML